jgi:uncharacterized protein YjaZ
MKSWTNNNFEISLFFDNLNLRDAGKIIEKNIEEIKDNNKIGFAGFIDKKILTSTINKFSLDNKREHKYFDADEILKNDVIENAKISLKELGRYSKSKKYVFIFPCFDNFTIKEMDGIGGFCSWKNVLMIFLHPINNWENILKETIAHEFAHSISPFYNGGNITIGQGLIFEGLAEHFREFVFGGKTAPYCKAINKNKIKLIFNELKSKLNSKNDEFYSEVFFGTGKYPLWAGYSIGYYLIGKYLENKKNVDWNLLLRTNPQKIMKEIINSQNIFENLQKKEESLS